jgi:HEPN domain-containing protein
MTKPHEQWVYYASQDQLSMWALMREGIYSHACYHAQQAVEKMMKAYLVANQKPYPKTHGLMILHRLMEVDWLAEYSSDLRKLSEHYVPTRYPDAVVGALPDRLPGEGEAKDAMGWADDICALIKSKL